MIILQKSDMAYLETKTEHLNAIIVKIEQSERKSRNYWKIFYYLIQKFQIKILCDRSVIHCQYPNLLDPIFFCGFELFNIQIEYTQIFSSGYDPLALSLHSKHRFK